VLTMESSRVDRLDLRGLPVWERSRLVLEILDRLPPGSSLTVVTENEPRGMSARFAVSHKQVLVDQRRVAAREWHLTLTRADLDGDTVTTDGILRRTLPFGALDGDALTRIAEMATQHTARRGQVIFPEHSDWPFLGIVFEGTLALSSGNGSQRERIFYEIFPFETFGDVTLFDQSPSTARIIVLSKSARFLRIPRDVILATGMHHPELFVRLGKAVGQRTRLLQEALTVQATLPILARIANVLLPYAMPEKGLSTAMSPLPNMTQAQIAAAAGTVKEVAARAIAELESRGLLRRERGHIRFLDRQRLIELVRELS